MKCGAIPDAAIRCPGTLALWFGRRGDGRLRPPPCPAVPSGQQMRPRVVLLRIHVRCRSGSGQWWHGVEFPHFCSGPERPWPEMPMGSAGPAMLLSPGRSRPFNSFDTGSSERSEDMEWARVYGTSTRTGLPDRSSAERSTAGVNRDALRPLRHLRRLRVTAVDVLTARGGRRGHRRGRARRRRRHRRAARGAARADVVRGVPSPARLGGRAAGVGTHAASHAGARPTWTRPAARFWQ
jgi:hypothetical protein